MIREVLLFWSRVAKIPRTSFFLVVYLSLMTFATAISAADTGGAEIQGNYVLVGNPAATLTIEADKIYAKGPSVNITAEYSVISSSGNQVSISITDAGSSMGTALITIDNDTLRIRNNYYFEGDWKRR